MIPIYHSEYNIRIATSIWHINSTYKLIYWHFIVSGCVDSYSCKVI